MDYDRSIHHNPDAQAWAKFFVETTKDMDREVFRDESYMIAWFANAMMAMHDHLAYSRSAAYDDCIDAVNKIKDDPITDMGSHHKMEGSFRTAKSWMVAIAEDIEREIIARKEKAL